MFPMVVEIDGATSSLDFATFFEREHLRLGRAALLLTGNAAEAEDLAQEALSRVLERWDSVVTMESPTGYLYRTALNVNASACDDSAWRGDGTAVTSLRPTPSRTRTAGSTSIVRSPRCRGRSGRPSSSSSGSGTARRRLAGFSVSNRCPYERGSTVPERHFGSD
jgi:hypothetical protein